MVCKKVIMSWVMLIFALTVSQFQAEALTRIAAVDGKYFYSDNVNVRNWDASVQFCLNNGMRIASIESAAQWNALAAVKNTNGFKGWFWTSGKDVGPLAHYRWNGAQSISSYAVHFETSCCGAYHCLFFDSMDGPAMLRNEPCDRREGVICETNHNV